MTLLPSILGSSDDSLWLKLIFAAVLLVGWAIKAAKSAGKTNPPASKTRPPMNPPAPSGFPGFPAVRLTAPPPLPPRRPRRVVGPPPPPPRPVVVQPDSEAFPETRPSPSAARTLSASPPGAAGRTGSSIVNDLYSRQDIRSAIILTELLDPPRALPEAMVLEHVFVVKKGRL